ncbi:hemerythrin domain-containing protein [Nocardioides humilatus]|uniref:Hemerythrin domain-containing protein n=1 Tax=Nocardioides humilatus TaxID=2607660 RepID=A0A5B1LFZ0_9ACTN|nr:hemerythrin domain-containing protein [Nocardioides humilatus]KAA1419264.1 hemerythrin domain-containing protein [Nocardioides humilatus]
MTEAPTHNVVDLILKDHRELERLFDTLLDDPSSRPTLVPVMTTLLTAHSRAEEAKVYPAISEAGAGDDVEHSQEEHLAADRLAQEVAATDPTSPDFAVVLKKLIDAVKHHVEEEEETVLADLRERLDEDGLAELGVSFLAERERLLGDQPADITKDQLEQQAANVGVTGASSMSKDELASELQEHADL